MIVCTQSTWHACVTLPPKTRFVSVFNVLLQTPGCRSCQLAAFERRGWCPLGGGAENVPRSFVPAALYSDQLHVRQVQEPRDHVLRCGLWVSTTSLKHKSLCTCLKQLPSKEIRKKHHDRTRIIIRKIVLCVVKHSFRNVDGMWLSVCSKAPLPTTADSWAPCGRRPEPQLAPRLEPNSHFPAKLPVEHRAKNSLVCDLNNFCAVQPNGNVVSFLLRVDQTQNAQ